MKGKNWDDTKLLLAKPQKYNNDKRWNHAASRHIFVLVPVLPTLAVLREVGITTSMSSNILKCSKTESDNTELSAGRKQMTRLRCLISQSCNPE
jgi:hypothetical protein